MSRKLTIVVTIISIVGSSIARSAFADAVDGRYFNCVSDSEEATGAWEVAGEMNLPGHGFNGGVTDEPRYHGGPKSPYQAGSTGARLGSAAPSPAVCASARPARAPRLDAAALAMGSDRNLSRAARGARRTGEALTAWGM
jgi:hypothetical protein